VNNSRLLASEKFQRRDLNLRPTDPAGGTLSTQPPLINRGMSTLSLMSYTNDFSIGMIVKCTAL